MKQAKHKRIVSKRRKQIGVAIWNCKFARRFLWKFYLWLGDMVIYGKYLG